MDWILIALLAVLVVFMFFNSRRRQQRMRAEQEAKQNQTVPGAEVLLQGGLYGTIVEYDHENLDAPALVELAPGVVVKVHSQAILRIVTPTEEPEDETTTGSDAPEIESIPEPESLEETQRRLEQERKKNDD